MNKKLDEKLSQIVDAQTGLRESIEQTKQLTYASEYLIKRHRGEGIESDPEASDPT